MSSRQTSCEVYLSHFQQELQPGRKNNDSAWPFKWHGRSSHVHRVTSLRVREEDFGGLVYNTGNGAVYKVNKVGCAAVMKLLRGDDPAQISTELSLAREELALFLTELGVSSEM